MMPIFSYLRRRWIWDLGLLALVTVVVNSRMIFDGLNGVADLQWHVTWLQHFARGMEEGNLYPRWLGGTNFGYGSPTFMFYPPLVYYLGTALKTLGLSTEQAIVLLFCLGIFGCGAVMYGYQRSRTQQNSLPALGGAIAYMSAPYLSYMVYNFGSLSTLIAMIWLPYLWWMGDRAVEGKGWPWQLSLGWALLAFTHVPSLLLGAVVWVPYMLWRCRRRGKRLLSMLTCMGLGLGLASIFLVPAVIENAWVDVNAMATVGGATFYDRMIRFHHLWTTRINFDSHLNWAYFYHLLGSVALALIALALSWRQGKERAMVLRWLSLLLLLAIAMTTLTWPLWQLSATLLRVQSPTRLLSFFSMAGGALLSLALAQSWRPQRRWWIRVAVTALAVVLLMGNLAYAYKWSRRSPAIHNPGRADISYLDGFKEALYNPYQGTLPDVPEYRPLIDGQPPPAPEPGEDRVSVLSGQAAVQIQAWRSQTRALQIEAATPAQIKIRTFAYPAWQLQVNNQPQPIEVLADGAIAFDLPAGTHSATLTFGTTRAVWIGSILSMICAAISAGAIALKTVFH